MNQKQINVAAITVDETGRVVLSDDDLVKLSEHLDLAGGWGNTNNSCTNSANCGDSINNFCTNMGNCGGTNNLRCNPNPN